MIAKQASARHFWVFLSTNFFFLRLAEEGRKIGELERKMFENCSTPDGIWYFEYLSWVSPCWEQMLAIGAQAMYIACNDTSVIVINFRKSKTHAITDTYCIVNLILAYFTLRQTVWYYMMYVRPFFLRRLSTSKFCRFGGCVSRSLDLSHFGCQLWRTGNTVHSTFLFTNFVWF